MPDQPRPVWLTREQRDTLLTIWQHDLRAAEGDDYLLIADLVEAWDAAPADPTEAVAKVVREMLGVSSLTIEEILRALGMP